MRAPRAIRVEFLGSLLWQGVVYDRHGEERWRSPLYQGEAEAYMHAVRWEADNHEPA